MEYSKSKFVNRFTLNKMDIGIGENCNEVRANFRLSLSTQIISSSSKNVLIIKPTVAWLIKKISFFCGNRMLIAVFKINRHWTLSSVRWMQSKQESRYYPSIYYCVFKERKTHLLPTAANTNFRSVGIPGQEPLQSLSECVKQL